MSKNLKFVPGLLIGLPLLAFAFAGDTQGAFFGRVAGVGYGGDRVAVCRATGSDIMPYVKVTVPAFVAERFLEEGGTYPDSSGECPESSPEDVRQTIFERIIARLASRNA